MTMVSVIALIFVYGGAKMVLSGGNSEAATSARHMMTNALIGLVIILTSWLIIDTVIKVFIPTGTDVRQRLGAWHTIQCVDQVPLSDNAPDFAEIAAGTGRGTGGAQCSGSQTGICSPANLQSIFGTENFKASIICTAESGGDPASESRTDVVSSNKGKDVFSVGLFQINLTVHKLEGCGPNGTTLVCKDAFNGSAKFNPSTKSYYGFVTDRALYEQCVRAAKNPTCNMRNAKRIYQEAGSRWAPWTTARLCGI
jgi:hypothetical protein